MRNQTGQIKYLRQSWERPEENLAWDEALLDRCEQGGPQCLRIWESPVPFVVVGYGGQILREVKTEACRARGIPILRRCSGGGTVLQGPGSLNYSLALRIDSWPVESITAANRFVMERNRGALQSLLPGTTVTIQGHTDLAAGTLKFSGNAQRRKRQALLFHGTLLCGMPLDWIEDLLPMPPSAPSYREGRGHAAFLANLELPRESIVQALRQAWNAAEEFLPGDPDLRLRDEVDALVDERYGRRDWNWKR